MQSNDFLKSSVIRKDMEELLHCGVDWNRLSNTSILITGAYGMLASYMIYLLIYLNEHYGSGIQIYAQFRDKNKLKSRFGMYIDKPYFNAVQCDMSDELSLNGDVDYIIHAAGLASSNHYSECPVDVLLPNVIGTYHLLNLARLKKTRSFLFFSTGGVYGEIKNKPVITERDFGPVDPCSLHSCYEESKRMGETMCFSYSKQFKVPTKIVRITHSYGPTMDIDTDPRVFSEFIKNIINDEDIVIKSSGESKRAFCYITNAVAGFFTVLLDGVAGEAYNLTNPDEHLTISELAALLLELSGNRRNVVYSKRSNNESYIEDSNTGFSILSIEKIKALGWYPCVSAKEGFSRVISHFQALEND